MPASTPSTTGASGRARTALSEMVGGLPAAFWWIFVSTLVNRLGGFVVTFLALYLTTVQHYSPSYAGLVAALFGLGSTVSALGAGVLADRIGRRPTLLAAQVSNAAFTVLLGFTHGQLTIAVVAFFCGLSNNASRPAVSAVIADVVPAEHRVRAYALNYWAVNLGFGISAAVAGLIATHGFLALFLIDASTTLLCALVIFARIPETRPDAPVTTADAAPEPTVGLGAVLRDTRFMALVGLNLVLALVAQQGSTTLAVDMGRAGLSTSQVGLVASLNGVLIVLLQLPVTRLIEHRSRTAMLVTAALLTGWGYGLTALAGSSVAFFALTVAIWTVGEIVYTPKVVSLVAELAPTHARGRYQGMFTLSWAAAFAGPLAGGYLLQHLGSAVWWACSVLGTLAAAGFLLLGRTRRATEQPLPAAAAPAKVSA
jgi:MFS family permease